MAGVWIPLAAHLTPANAHDTKVAPSLIEALPQEARFVLGDTHYDAKDLKEGCLRGGRFLVSPRRGAYPHTDGGAEVIPNPGDRLSIAPTDGEGRCR